MRHATDSEGPPSRQEECGSYPTSDGLSARRHHSTGKYVGKMSDE